LSGHDDFFDGQSLCHTWAKTYQRRLVVIPAIIRRCDMGKIHLAFTYKELIPNPKKNLWIAVIETRMSALSGEAEMRGECGIIAAAN
jgi:hypothetical protein